MEGPRVNPQYAWACSLGGCRRSVSTKELHRAATLCASRTAMVLRYIAPLVIGLDAQLGSQHRRMTGQRLDGGVRVMREMRETIK